MSSSTAGNIVSPDFKRVTGKLRIVRRKSRLSTSTSVAEELAASSEVFAVPRRSNPFKSLDENWAGSNDDFVIPKTPEKSSTKSISLDLSAYSDVFTDTPERLETPRNKKRRLSNICDAQTENQSTIDDRSKSSAHGILSADHSLFMKIQVNSQRKLNDIFELSTLEGNQAMQSFVLQKVDSENEPLNIRFHRQLFYYQYPDLPWLSLFPRKEDRKATSSGILDFTGLFNKWKAALQSAYTSLVTFSGGASRDFYVFCEGFSVFSHRCRKCGQILAVVSPTTRGLRQSLQNKGIEFLMPLTNSDDESSENERAEHSNSVSDKSQTLIENQSDDMQNKAKTIVDEDDPLEWLEDIGLERSSFPSLRAAKVQMESESFRKIDYKPSSTILICGERDVGSLVDFLITYEKCAATTGQLANVPPTIVCRYPFLHSVLNKLQARYGTRHSDEGELQTYIDITGPAFPDVVSNIAWDLSQPLQHETVNISLHRLGDSYVNNSVLYCKCSQNKIEVLPSHILCQNGSVFLIK